YCDPLELRAESQIGVPGMVRAVRAGKLTTINSLGSGVLASRFLMAFLPTLARELLGEDLQLPSIATWWLGDDAAREQALGAGASTVTLTATGSSLPVDDGHLARDAIDPSAAMGASRFDAVAQEVVRLSTLPARARPDGAGDAGPLVPKPVSLRVFLVRHETGWSVMPGGFCRVGATPDPRALSMQRGSRSADVWIRSEAPVAQTSLLPQPGKTPVKRVPGTLPARAADNLFWLGRYTERAQLAIRLARAYTERRLDGIAPSDPIVTLAASQLRAWGVDDPEDPEVFETSLVSDLRRAHQAASAIRDRFSPDAWQGLNRFVARFESGALQTLSPIERLDAALAMLASFAGLISENMVRLSGWRFLEIGRRLERAFGTCQAIETFGVRSSQAGALELLLELADSVMSYRQRYAVTTDRQTVADLVMLDPNNPRSVAFQLERIHLHVNEITDHKAFDQTSALQKRAFSAWSVLHTASAGDVDLAMIKQTQSSLLDLSGAITTSYLSPALASEKVGGGA
ncbi:MAG: circularly permuted type 2 ATP-grasp protein, partial [Devosiaceae bacterium]|nr:circularly permuted type 2 ATP-grasp protein [Devosiaceae bacterium MH13]